MVSPTERVIFFYYSRHIDHEVALVVTGIDDLVCIQLRLNPILATQVLSDLAFGITSHVIHLNIAQYNRSAQCAVVQLGALNGEEIYSKPGESCSFTFRAKQVSRRLSL